MLPGDGRVEAEYVAYPLILANQIAAIHQFNRLYITKMSTQYLFAFEDIDFPCIDGRTGFGGLMKFKADTTKINHLLLSRIVECKQYP